MRQVDTDALADVAGTLDIGAPGTATEAVSFDDSNLQQVLDVSRNLRGLGLFRGWHGFLFNMAHVATGEVFASTDPYVFVENNGGTRLDHLVWVMDVSCFALEVAGNSIDRIAAGYVQPIVDGYFPVGMNTVLLVEGAGPGLNNFLVRLRNDETGQWAHSRKAVDTAAASGRSFELPVQTPRLPQPVFPGGTLRVSSVSTIAAGGISARVAFTLWAGPKGMLPPRVA